MGCLFLAELLQRLHCIPSPCLRFASAVALSVSEKPGVGTGGIVGIVMVIFLVLLVAVDTTCYFTNHCGLMMCIAVNLLGKRPPGAKGLDEEERNVSTV